MNSKLSPETIEAIRNTPGKQRDVARRFGISQAQVSRIQSHKSWSAYPYDNGDVIVLGPEVFVSKDGSVISYRGQNYYRASNAVL